MPSRRSCLFLQQDLKTLFCNPIFALVHSVLCFFMHVHVLECPSHVLDLNQPGSLNVISNCTILNGNLIVTGLSNTICGPNGLSLPRLFEILGSLTIEHSSCSGDLSHFLPNLIAIHGIFSFPDSLSLGSKVSVPPFDLLIHHTALSGIGLRCLRVIGRHGVLLIDNPQMCYTDTVGWHLLSPSLTDSRSPITNLTVEKRNDESSPLGRKLLNADGLFDLCANACPMNCKWITVNNLPRSFCWSRNHCQYSKLSHIHLPNRKNHFDLPCFLITVCSSKCRDNGLTCSMHNTKECCHPNCLGGCTGPTSDDCLICRNFHYNNTCLSNCPDGLFGVIYLPQFWLPFKLLSTKSDNIQCVCVWGCQNIEKYSYYDRARLQIQV